MSIDPQVVDYIAELARLDLDDDEREALAAELARIVEFVRQLEEVDITDVAPTKDVSAEVNVGRADEPRDGLSRDEALAGAPSVDEGHFLVPKVLPD